MNLYDDARKQETVSRGVLALQHIYDAFESEGVTRIATRRLLFLLADREDGPWAKDWGKDLQFNIRKPQSALAQLLKEFEVHSTDVKIGKDSLKGYRKEDFLDAWRRYGVFPSGDATKGDHATVQVRGHEIGRVNGRGRVTDAEGWPSWTFRCDGCGDEQEDASTTALPGIHCYTNCGGKYQLVEEVA